MNEDRFSVYEAPDGGVWIKDRASVEVDTTTLYVSYSSLDHKPGPVNAKEYALAVVAVLNSGTPENVAAKLHKI